MKVLMIGTTGEFASLAIPAFKRKGIRIKGLVRNEHSQGKAIKNGADETVTGDLEDPDSLLAALDGADAVFHLNPAFDENESQLGRNMVRAAQNAGVKKFIFSSVYHPSLSLVNHAAKRPVEEALFESNLTFVILQPAMFMQTLAASWPAITKTRTLALPYSQYAKMSYVDYRDVAEAAALALIGNDLDYGTFELCSGDCLDRFQLAEMITSILHIPFQAQDIPFETFSATTKLPDGYLKEGMRAMFAHYDRYGFHGGNSFVLKSILGHHPRTMQNYITELVSSS